MLNSHFWLEWIGQDYFKYKKQRGRSSPYQLDNQRWRIGGLCPIVKLSMPKELGEKKTGPSFATSPKPQSLLIQMFFCRARSRQSTTRRISASCFFLPVAFFGTRKIYLLSTDCMWDFLSPVDFTQSFLPLAGVRLQFMSSYIKMVTAGAGLVQLCVYWSRFKDWSLRPLVEWAYVWATTLYISWSMRKSTLYKQTEFEQTYKTIKPQNHVRLISSFKISI